MTGGRRLLVPLGALVGVLCALTVALLVPGTRTVLRDSFTELPTQYTELYLQTDPSLVASQGGETVSAHATIVRHGTGGPVTEHVLSALAVDGAAPTRTVDVVVPIERPTTVDVSLPMPAHATTATLNVVLVGSQDSLRYRISSTPGKTP
jgi:hypothetical protein